MLYRVIVLYLLATLLLWSDSNSTIQEDHSLFAKEEIALPSHVIHISFDKKQYLDESDLLQALGADTKSIFEFWSDKKPTIKDKLIPSLEESLRSHLDSEGFYDAVFDIKTTKTDLYITIKENEPVRVADINISSNADISDRVTFKKGDIFTAKKFIAIKNSIIEQMMKEGYCSYSLDNKAYVDLDTYRVDLKYDLDKGGVCTFGKVSVKGLKSIDDEVVISRIRAREGKRFSTERIQESYDALYALDAFDAVAVKYDRKFYNVVPVDVVAAEITKPWSFMGGVGFDTNVGPYINMDLIRKNFMGDAKKLRVSLKYSRIEQLAEVSIFTPALFNFYSYYLDLSSKIGYSNLEYTGFMEKKEYIEAYLAYINEKWELNAGFAMSNIEISLLNDYDEAKLTQAITPGTFFLAYPFFRFVYDNRDSKLNPKFGYYFSGMVEYGLPYAEDASAYLKYQLEGRAIYTISNLTMAVVAKAGIVDEKQNHVPESKLFFGGGAYSNRAYGYKRVGVILSPTRYGIEGARTMANLSLEADYPLVGNIYGAIFTDNTMLTINSYDFTGEVISSAGVGVRYMTPIGPIKIDIAANVRDVTQYGIQFQIGQSF